MLSRRAPYVGGVNPGLDTRQSGDRHEQLVLRVHRQAKAGATVQGRADLTMFGDHRGKVRSSGHVPSQHVSHSIGLGSLLSKQKQGQGV